MLKRTTLLILMLAAEAGEIRPGVTAASRPQELPLPVHGYQVYMVGEFHGLAENAVFQLQYLEQLYASAGLRDVAIEEKSVYQALAQDYVQGRVDKLTPSLCLRAAVLDGIRRLNTAHPDAPVRVHLTDVDSPATAIREHLLALQQRITGSSSLAIPQAGEIKEHGLKAVGQLKQRDMDSVTASELRTVEHSIRAFQDGLEVDTGRAKGSPYLEDREQAVASNIEDLIRVQKIESLLVLYGADHVSRTPRGDGGPKRDHPFMPVALRLQKSGLAVYSLVTFPLTGKSWWRGQGSDLMWTARDGHLESGETLDKVLARQPAATFLFIDTRRQHAMLPSQDVSRYEVDAFLLFRSVTAMDNRCSAR